MADKKEEIKEQIRSIVIICRKWFQKSKGNAYHSVKICVNGELEIKIPFKAGCEIQTALEELKKMELIPAYHASSLWRLRTYCQGEGIDLVTSVTRVGRKKDLMGC